MRVVACFKPLTEKIGAYLYRQAAIPRIIHNKIISIQKFRLDLSWKKIKLVLVAAKNLEPGKVNRHKSKLEGVAAQLPDSLCV